MNSNMEIERKGYNSYAENQFAVFIASVWF